MRIAVLGLSKRFGTVRVLDGVDLDVAPGEAVAVLGPSGCGKTTLLRLIAGLERPDAGEIRLDDELASDPQWLMPPHRRHLGFAFQRSALWPHMTVADNILFGVHGIPRDAARARLGELLDRFDLADLGKRYPDQISGGQARRVSLARALAPRPRALLLDEPLTNLEPELKERLLDLVVTETRAVDTSLLYVTHDSWEASRIASRRLRLAGGRLLPLDGLPTAVQTDAPAAAGGVPAVDRDQARGPDGERP